MPFTAFHLGPSVCIALPFCKRINVLVFILANVAIDIEPLIVIIFGLSYPLHGLTHTFIGATIIGVLWGVVAYHIRGVIKYITVDILKLPYDPSLKKMAISGMLGALSHVLLDAPLYADIRPFYPSNYNPFYGKISHHVIYTWCTILLIPALILYLVVITLNKRRIS